MTDVCPDAGVLPGPRVVPPPEFAHGSADPIALDYAQLPAVDPLAPLTPPDPGPVRRLPADECRAAAVKFPPPPDPFAPGITAVWWDELPPEATTGTAAATDLLCEARGYIDATARNTAAGLALNDFYQLADALGRGGLLRDAVGTLDALRRQTWEARSNGAVVPVQPDALDRQRATLVGLLGKADLAAEVLTISLKRRTGVSGQDPDRLWPTGPFGVSADPVDEPAAVQFALESRPDLQLLRLLYIRLNPETLPAVRELWAGGLGSRTGDTAAVDQLAGPMLGRLSRCRGARAKSAEIDAAARAEVVVMRQRLADLIAARERQVADEVRTAAATMAAQARQIGLARWHAEQRSTAVADANSSGPLAVLAAELEAAQARADVIAAVMTWHQARVRLETACGRYAGQP